MMCGNSRLTITRDMSAHHDCRGATEENRSGTRWCTALVQTRLANSPALGPVHSGTHGTLGETREARNLMDDKGGG